MSAEQTWEQAIVELAKAQWAAHEASSAILVKVLVDVADKLPQVTAFHWTAEWEYNDEYYDWRVSARPVMADGDHDYDVEDKLYELFYESQFEAGAFRHLTGNPTPLDDQRQDAANRVMNDYGGGDSHESGSITVTELRARIASA